MMVETHYAAAARCLRNAYSGAAVAPLRNFLDPADIDGAYAVQTINTHFWEAQGRRIIGRKAGDILLAGALGPMIALTAGDQVHARIAGIGECNFTYDEA